MNDTLADAKAPAGEIRTKLTELRMAREKGLRELSKTRDDLRALLTTKQESFLVLIGLLD